MSTSFQLRYLFGLVPSAKKIDSQWSERIKLKAELQALETSKEMSRYRELKQQTQSQQFIQHKINEQRLNFKDSAEFKKIHELRDIEHHSTIKHYLHFVESHDYERFKKVATSKEVMRFAELKKIVESPEFIKRKKENESAHYKGSPEEAKREEFEAHQNDAKLKQEYKKLEHDHDVHFYIKTTESAEYKNFIKTEGSTELKRYHELKSAVEKPEFKERVAYLKNKHRWETTPEYAIEKEVIAFEHGEVFKKYTSLKKDPTLKFFDDYQMILNEDFSKNQLKKEIWETENYWGKKLAGFSFSQVNELHAYNGMKNIELNHEVLSIVTKAEKSESKVWDPKLGLVPKKFDYTSSTINSGNGFSFKEGIIETKVKFKAYGALTSACSLTTTKPFPQIDLFRSGHKSVGMGMISKPGNEGIKKLKQIKGLNFDEYHIFSLEYSKNQLIWKINNQVVHSENLTTNPGELFVHFTGSLHEPLNGEHLPHRFEIDWIRCYTKK